MLRYLSITFNVNGHSSQHSIPVVHSSVDTLLLQTFILHHIHPVSTCVCICENISHVTLYVSISMQALPPLLPPLPMHVLEVVLDLLSTFEFPI